MGFVFRSVRISMEALSPELEQIQMHLACEWSSEAKPVTFSEHIRNTQHSNKMLLKIVG